jgi:hypothetical protein
MTFPRARSFLTGAGLMPPEVAELYARLQEIAVR